MDRAGFDFLGRLFDRVRLREVPLTKRNPITFNLQELFERLIDLSSPDVIVEVGAFEAAFSKEMTTRYPSSTVIAFEANPRVYQQFAQGLKEAGVDYRHLAVADRAGSISIHIPEEIAEKPMPYVNRMASIFENAMRGARTSEVLVEAVRLDDVIDPVPGGNIVLWIDVEGGVDQVLSGATHTLDRTSMIICELERGAIWRGQTLDKGIVDRLEQSGFTPVARDCQKSFQYNAIFVRRDRLDRVAEIEEAVSSYISTTAGNWMRAVPLTLFQYWDTPEAPDEVEALMGSWKSDPAFTYRRFDRASAREMIATSVGEGALAAFEACRVPAMQADLFRLCALYAFGGVYMDADIGNLGRNERLFTSGDRGLLFIRHRKLANDLMVVHNKSDALIKYALDRAVENVASRKTGGAWAVTGPGILTELYRATSGDHPLLRGFDISDAVTMRQEFGFNWELSYKKSESHWVNLKDASIYSA